MKSISIAALFVLATSQAVWAWGQDGHSIVSEIAQRRLDKTARDRVDQLLGHGSLASVASWADDVKFLDRPETKPWHFVNIPLSSASYQPQRDCAADNCIIAALRDLKTQLNCATDDDRKRDALRFVVHLIGDIHQPLHTVAELGGGNGISVKVGFCGLKQPKCNVTEATVTFHEIWDETLIGNTFYDWGAYVGRLESGWLASQDAASVQNGSNDPIDWAQQAHAEAETVWNKRPANGEIDEVYYQAVLPILDKQLGTAGIRLARFLNDAYGSGSCPAK